MSIQWEKVVEEYLDFLLSDDEDSAIDKTRSLLKGGVTPTELFENCISPALQEIGNRFETLDIFLPEMVAAADIVEKINTQVLKPAIEISNAAGDDTQTQLSLGKVCMASIGSAPDCEMNTPEIARATNRAIKIAKNCTIQFPSRTFTIFKPNNLSIQLLLNTCH